MNIKRLFIWVFPLALLNFAQAQEALQFEIDVTKNTDTFWVKTNIPGKLTKKNKVFQFASTAPGTYQTMNIGRYISDFKAFDKNGKNLSVKFEAPNQYIFSKPKKVKSLSYKAAETFDTQLKEYPIYLMAGSSIEKDNALINAHTCVGYFHGMQGQPIDIKISGKPEWTTGTALKEKNGWYHAESFDHLVDSPILTGNLSYAETQVVNTPIRIFTYSEKGKFNSAALLEKMKAMLESSEKFLIDLPVDNYTFLYYFIPNPPGVTGAWEHSYSSEYVLGEEEPSEEYMKQVSDIASHEFFHVVTPLNIHSEIIEKFNFENPTPSQHLWLYEGVTEWASHVQLMRGGVNSLETHLQDAIAQKVVISEVYFKPEWSLTKIAEESFLGGEGAKQYGNIYYKGALVATYLDIQLLELSGGKTGLREVLLQLVKKYGKGNPFNEATFFDDLAAMTYPEIKTFADKYIKGNQPLPHAEMLAKIGLSYERPQKNKAEVKKMDQLSATQQLLFDAWSVNK